jgi:hypothetical protein
VLPVAIINRGADGFVGGDEAIGFLSSHGQTLTRLEQIKRGANSTVADDP